MEDKKTQEGYEKYYRALCKDIVETIGEIDKKTTWTGAEPEWWLLMMKLQRMAYEHRETLK